VALLIGASGVFFCFAPSGAMISGGIIFLKMLSPAGAILQRIPNISCNGSRGLPDLVRSQMFLEKSNANNQIAPAGQNKYAPIYTSPNVKHT